ncbi:helix-turn-helix domain-containing protein [Nocardiopsis rhodophaea]|uniref:helix-turn-helix domain-containing protein n=1 Tax=Nocardiopsis rhodophaea TaxID=280238 RepID=UPI0039F143C7
MSIQVMSWVWDHSRTTNGARLVLLAIADCASGDGTNAWPSTEELCRKTNLSERAVQAGIKKCVELGELKVELHAGRRGTNLFTVIMRTPAESAPPQDVHPAKSAPPQNLPGSEEPQVNLPTPAGSAPPAESAPPQNQRRTPAESAPGTVNEPSLDIDIDAFLRHPPGEDPPPPGSDNDPWFRAFWDAYPKKKSKGEARKAWAQVLALGADARLIITAARRYAADRTGEDPRFTAYPATWLRAERYNDEPDPQYRPTTSSRRPPASNADVWDQAAARLSREEHQ